ncbi:hypothetical protein ACTQXY_01770 [Faecalimonas sp. LCP19S3_D12]
MKIERISTNIDLHGRPKNGTQAYSMLISSLKQEIKEKQDILHYLQKDNVKQSFIESYNPNTKTFEIHDFNESEDGEL